jgi:hypothetical protein
MLTVTFKRRAMSLAVALAFAIPSARLSAQATSEQRIPVRKDQQIKVKEARGEVDLAPTMARINELEASALTLKARLNAAETASASRFAAAEMEIAALKDSLRIVNEELAMLRNEVAKASALAAALSDSVTQLNKSVYSLRYGSLFGKSGFYLGVGTGANFTMGTLNDIGYAEGFNVNIPIGWSKGGYPIGFRTEWGVQTFEGTAVKSFTNIDPVLYTATAMLTLNLPMNAAKTNLFYLMGGGGAFMFHRFGELSALSEPLGNKAKDVTKWGLTGGAGLELHVLGPTSLFVQSSFTNVFVEKSAVAANGSKNLRWIPLVAGITLR